MVAPLEQRDVGTRAHTAHADDHARDVDESETFQQLPATIVERGAVVVKELGENSLHVVGVEAVGTFDDPQRNDERRLADDSILTFDDLTELRECLQAVVSLRLLKNLFAEPQLLQLALLGRRAADHVEGLLRGQVGVPDRQGPHFGEAAHSLAVRGYRCRRNRAVHIVAEAVVATGDDEARRKALQVVLERARQGLVEVVEVEQQRAFGRREHTKVQEVRIPAELHVEAGARRVLQVGGHHLRRAAVEREGRHHHATVPHRDEIRLAERVLFLEHADGIGAIRRRLPPPMARARNKRACRSACGEAVLDATASDPTCGHAAPCLPSPFACRRVESAIHDDSAATLRGQRRQRDVVARTGVATRCADELRSQRTFTGLVEMSTTPRASGSCSRTGKRPRTGRIPATRRSARDGCQIGGARRLWG